MRLQCLRQAEYLNGSCFLLLIGPGLDSFCDIVESDSMIIRKNSEIKGFFV